MLVAISIKQELEPDDCSSQFGSLSSSENQLLSFQVSDSGG